MADEFDPKEFDASKPKNEFNPEEFRKSKPSALEAGATGLLQGATANWSDEMMAASAASGLPQAVPGTTPIGAARLAWEHLTGNRGPATETYESTLKQIRERNKQLQNEHPYAYGTGEIGGAVGSMALAPARAAVTLPGRIASGVASGAGYGAIAGAGEGEGGEDSIKQAGTGALTGAGLGLAGAGAYEALAPVARRVGDVWRGIRTPDDEAARRVASHLTADWNRAGPSLTPEELAAANAAGLPRAIIDAGGESTRALARSAANSSPEARAALSEMARDRFETQSPRVADFIRTITGGANAGADLETLQTAARRANRPAYQAAYSAGSNGVWNPEIERLVGASPSVQQAMKNAVQRGADRAAVDGMGAFNPKVTFDNGVLNFRRGNGIPAYPDIQFWDYTQRELRDMASSAQRSGRNEEYGALVGLRRNLLGQLDTAVPEFAQARGGAARFFGADNALEAGEKFVNYTTNARNDISMRQALGRMNPFERELFARGYASKLSDNLERGGDNRNILNSSFVNNGPARQRTLVALGPQRAGQLEALLRAEAVVDHARTSLGNSTTARQLMEMGLAGGATAGATGLLEQNFNPQHLITSALMGGILHRGAQAIDQRVARRVGEMLASNDPTILARGAQIASQNPSILNALRAATNAGVRGATEVVQPSVNSAFAHGGAIIPSKNDAQEPKGPTSAQSRQESHYSPTRGVAAHNCGICKHFREKNKCTIVGGFISKAGGCDWFEPKNRAEGGRVNFADGGDPELSPQDQALSSTMTHQAEQPNPAKPVIDFTKNFYEGGLHQALQGAGVQMPDWSGKISSFLNNPSANVALGMVGGMPTYSAAGEAVRNAKSQVMQPSQWLGYLKNQPGVKAQELEHVGLEPFLKEKTGPVHRDELDQFIQSKQPEIKEVKYGQTDWDNIEKLEDQLSNTRDKNEQWKIQEQIDNLRTKAPQYQEYQLPGASNYGETLLTLPQRGFEDINPPYRSSHWKEPNVLLHVRHNDRDIPGVGKSLHMEELQSDFAQQFRKYKQQIADEVDKNFDTIADNMVQSGVIKKVCD